MLTLVLGGAASGKNACNHSCCIISCHICGYLLRTGSGSH